MKLYHQVLNNQSSTQAVVVYLVNQFVHNLFIIHNKIKRYNNRQRTSKKNWWL